MRHARILIIVIFSGSSQQMLRTKLHILANTRNRRSITVRSQLILTRDNRRTLNFRLDPRHLSNGGKSDVPKPDPGSEACTSESELQGTAIDSRKNDVPYLVPVTLQQPQNSGSSSLPSSENQSIKEELNSAESEKFQPVKIEHVVTPSGAISASSLADGSSEPNVDVIEEGTVNDIVLFGMIKFLENLKISPSIIYLQQKQRRRNSRKI